MSEPLVSVIMPAYNAEKYIGESIDSIINQTFREWELIIIEDCSQDNTLSVINQYLADSRIKLYQNEKNLGIAYSRNKAIRNSRGRYIAIQDDDDVSFPDRLMDEVRFLEDHEELDAVAGHWLMVDESGHNVLKMIEAYQNPKYVRAQLLLHDCIGNGSAMFRKNFAEANDIWYQNNMLGMEDYRFWIEFSKKGNISAIDRIVYKNRRHDSRESAKMTLEKEEERKQLFLELQILSLKLSGIVLTEESMDALRTFAGEKTNQNALAGDYIKLYNAFQEIIRKAKGLELDYSEEIAIACRKILGTKIANSKGLWNVKI